MTTITITIPIDLLRTLVNAADEGADARHRDADAQFEQGDDEQGQIEREVANEYQHAVRQGLALLLATSD